MLQYGNSVKPFSRFILVLFHFVSVSAAYLVLGCGGNSLSRVVGTHPLVPLLEKGDQDP